MERKEHLKVAIRTASGVSATLLATATVWDVARITGRAVAPAVSYALVGLAVALACGAVLARALSRRPAAWRNAIELLVAGVVLLSWWLRGDPDIPADPPLVAAELLGALVLGGSAIFARRRAAAGAVTGPLAR